MDTHLTIPLPVEPLDIVPLVGNQLNDAACIIGYIKKDIIGARESCDTAARLCPSFASYLEIITRKLLTLQIEVSNLVALAESGHGPKEK